MIPERDRRTIDSEFDVWLSRDMLFNTPPGLNIRKYSKYTKAKKIKYTRMILRYLDRMEEVGFRGRKCRAVAIRLGKIIRYVWRSDLLSRREYEEIQKEQRLGLEVLRKKQRGSVDNGGVD